MWFNTNAYTPDSVPGTLGDVSPASIAGPALVNLDFGMAKTFPIHENVNLEFQLKPATFMATSKSTMCSSRWRASTWSG
jgi:hypothetical protein